MSHVLHYIPDLFYGWKFVPFDPFYLFFPPSLQPPLEVWSTKTSLEKNIWYANVSLCWKLLFKKKKNYCKCCEIFVLTDTWIHRGNWKKWGNYKLCFFIPIFFPLTSVLVSKGDKGVLISFSYLHIHSIHTWIILIAGFSLF